MADKRGEMHEAYSFAPEPIRRIEAAQSGLTLKQRLIARFMLENPEKIGFLSIREVAQQVGLSIASVSRFCKHLGYSGYEELGREVQEGLQYEMTTPARLRMLHELAGEGQDAAATAFDRVIEMEVQNLISLRRTRDRTGIERCVEWLHEAETVTIVGSMGSTALAEYLAYALSKVRRSVRLVSHASGSSDWLGLSNLGSGSLVVVLGFPRYQRRTIEIAEYARTEGARVVALTDQESSPLARAADLVLPVPITLSTIVDSFAAPLVMIHALIAEYGERFRDDVQQNLLDFERYTRELSIWPDAPRRSSGIKPRKPRRHGPRR